MNTHADKTQENKSQSISNGESQIQISGESPFQFVDNRPEAIAQRKLQDLANNSPQARQAAQLQAMADNYSAQQKSIIQMKENNTGLPDNLKSGIGNLSGYSMDDVKVYYNSDKPAQLQALAYAQGTDIHLGSGQEKHLPHEAWHVVQQKQGRVKPILQMKGGVNVNDDKELENEADVMGAKASEFISNPHENSKLFKSKQLGKDTFQLVRLNGKIEIGKTLNLANPNQVAQLVQGKVICDVGPHPYIYSEESDISYDIPDGVDLKFGDVITFDTDDSDLVIVESVKVTSNYVPVEEDLEEDDYAIFSRVQKEKRATVMAAAGLAITRINQVLSSAGPFKSNLAAIQKYISSRAQNYDEGHFLCSPTEDGPANELAHSKSSGTIELFKGFFESSSTVKADLLVHESVHSLFKVPDFAYIWQPVIKYLPPEVQLKNPDSYVALLRGVLAEEDQTPVLDVNPAYNFALSMIQHVAMRSSDLMAVCKNQLYSFDDQALPQPLSLLKVFKNSLNKEEITSLIKLSIGYSAILNNLVLGNKVKIVTKTPIPTKMDDAEVSDVDGTLNIDFIQPDSRAPYVVLMAKIMQSQGLNKSWAAACATSMDYLVSQTLVDADSMSL